MAHNLASDKNGNIMMAYAGETPWHELGSAVANDLSPDEMLKAAHLDWEVRKIPAFSDIAGKRVNVGWSALVRANDNQILDIVSNDWIPNQNSDAFEFFREFVEAGDMEMHTAGALQDGRIVWALAKVKDSFNVFNGDVVESHLLFTNPHRFGQSIDVRFTPIRVVCNNTLSLALNAQDKRMVKVNHRRAFDTARVKETLGIASYKLNKYKEMAEFLGSKAYTPSSLKDYFTEIFPVLTTRVDENGEKNPRKEVSKSAARAIDIVELQPGADFARGTWWNAFNATTFMIDHEIGRSEDTRLVSAWFGANSRLKVKALEKAVDYANAA